LYVSCSVLSVPTRSHPLSLHDALPILSPYGWARARSAVSRLGCWPVIGSSFLWVGAGRVRTGWVGLCRRRPGCCPRGVGGGWGRDRKSTRLNSSHVKISYAVFCLKKKK